jgi:hypothetical protein
MKLTTAALAALAILSAVALGVAALHRKPPEHYAMATIGTSAGVWRLNTTTGELQVCNAVGTNVVCSAPVEPQ